MLEQPFIKSLNDFLQDRADTIDFFKASLQYKKTEEKLDELNNQLNGLLNDDGKRLLLTLDSEHNARMTIAAEASYQRGFAEGIKLIIYSLIVSQ